VTYKRDISDVRESPALEIAHHLRARGADLSYSDPFVPSLKLDGEQLEAREADAALLRESDLVVIVTDHSRFDYAAVAEHARLVLDTRNAIATRADHVRRL
jgi:UDP-N-acetyl-D-glucosamine dehydrogenase